MTRRAILFLVLAFVLSSSTPARADEWNLPHVVRYYSANRKHCVEIIPRRLESQSKYLEDKLAGERAPGSKRGDKAEYCKAIAYKQDDTGSYQKEWEGRLSNDVAPLNALVSNDGAYLVTFDNWHFVGHGDDVVAIYGGDGKMIKRISLEEIVPRSEILRMPMSVSSIYWGGKHLLDEANGLLILRVVSKWSGSFDDLPEYKDVKVDLATGSILRGPPTARLLPESPQNSGFRIDQQWSSC